MASRDLRTWKQARGSRLRLDAYPPGFPVHVVIGTHQSKPIFENADMAKEVWSHLAAHPRTRTACLMSDHLHWLLGDCVDLVDVVRRFKSWTTRRMWSIGGTGRVWQRSFFDTVLRTERQVRAVSAYILANPVRAGLVHDAEDYPWICGLPGANDD